MDGGAQASQGRAARSVFQKGLPPDGQCSAVRGGWVPGSKPVIQHNADTKPLNPLIVVNQALPIPVVVLEKPLQSVPHQETVPDLYRRPVIRPQIIQQLQ